MPDEQSPEMSGSSDRRRRGRVTVDPRTTARMDGNAKQTEDEKLLTRPTRPAFMGEDPWRVLRIQAEFVDGFDALATLGPAVTVFGSARIREGSQTYELARAIGTHLGRESLVSAITTEQLQRPAPRPRYSVLDTTRHAAIAGAPLPEWRDALRRHLEHRTS